MHPADLGVVSTIALFLTGLILLILSGRGAVAHLDILSRQFQLGRFQAAFVIMAISTSLPELFVGISSAIAGVPALSAGTVLGSNIADITIIFGIVVLLAGRLLIRTTFLRDASFRFAAIALLPFLLLLDGVLSRFDGILLLMVFTASLWHMLKHHPAKLSPLGRSSKRNFPLMYFLLSVAGLLIAAHLIVTSSVSLATVLGVSPFLIGLLAVALGTSLPELAFETAAVRKGKGDFALGDAAGSVVCNATLVLGITALLRPLRITLDALFVPITITILALFLLLIPLKFRQQYTRPIGIGMLVLYAVFLIAQLEHIG